MKKKKEADFNELRQCFPNFHLYVNHLGILLKCKFALK